jgi:hypothetical protein
MPVAATASGLPEDQAPAQPLPLLSVLDQEFTELHAGDPGTQTARRLRICLSFISEFTV